MINFQELTVEQIKEQYSERHGFVFQGAVKSPDSAVENLCNVLINKEITSEYPACVVRLSDTVTVFVYGDDFDGPTFYNRIKMPMAMAQCRIMPLIEFLQHN